jgi:hypothetical protein
MNHGMNERGEPNFYSQSTLALKEAPVKMMRILLLFIVTL